MLRILGVQGSPAAKLLVGAALIALACGSTAPSPWSSASGCCS
jgi:hypothetical protein